MIYQITKTHNLFWKIVLVTAFVALSWILFTNQAHAATKTWTNGNATGIWNDAANWSPASLPTTTDDIVFDTTSTANSAIDTVGLTINSFTINSGYTGTISTSTNTTLTVTGDMVINSGSSATVTHAAGAAKLWQVTNFTINSGATFTMNLTTSADFTVNGDMTIVAGSTTNITVNGTTASDFSVLGNYTQNTGTFTVTSGKFNMGDDTSDVFLQTAGSFVLTNDFFLHNGADFTLSGGTFTANSSSWFNIQGVGANVLDVNTSLTFDQFQIASNSTATLAAGDTLIVVGSAMYLDGELNGLTGATYEYQGNGSGSFFVGSGDILVKWTGSNNQVIDEWDIYYEMEVDKTGGTLNFSQQNMHNTMTITSNTVITQGYENIYTSGATLVMNNGTFNAGSNTLLVQSGGAATIAGGTYNASSATSTVNDGGTFTVSGGTVNAAGSFDVAGDMILSTGSFNTNGSTFLVESTGSFTQSGGTFTSGADTPNFDGPVIVSGGTFNLSSGNTTFAGNVTFSGGSFTHNSGTVVFDGAGVSTITGDITFNNLSSVTAGKVIVFNAGDTQTIGGTLTLTGASGNLIVLRSNGNLWNLVASGTIDVSYVNATNSDASGGSQITHTNSFGDGQGNINWAGWLRYFSTDAPNSVDTAFTHLGTAIDSDHAGVTVTPGERVRLFWDSEGTIDNVNLFYMVDGGDVISLVNNFLNVGQYDWDVPANLIGKEIKFKIEGTDGLDTFASYTSISIPITSETTIITPEEPNTTPLPTVAVSGFFRGVTNNTVYFRPSELIRRPFINAKIFFTWSDTFDKVIFVSDDVLHELTLGRMMLPKPGVTLIQIESTYQIYASFTDPTDSSKLLLRNIVSPEVAESLYGSNWETYILEVPTTMWSSFTIGEPINATTNFIPDLSIMKKNTQLK